MKFKFKLLSITAFLVLTLNLVLSVKAEPDPDLAKNNIPVVFGIDENYFYPCVVSMTSLLENANENTFYNIYVIHSKEFSNPYKLKIFSLKENYKNCDIKFCEVKNEFDTYKNEGYFTKAIFHRLEIPGLVNEDKCIYLDSDTIINEDLSELFNFDINNYYVAGIRDGTDSHRFYREYLKKIGMSTVGNYINSGVILWNLKKVREDNLQQLFYQFVEKHVIEKCIGLYPDQDCINVVCDGKILNLPIRFNTMAAAFLINTYEENPKLKNFCQKSEWELAKVNPAIVHYLGGRKPWKGDCKFWYNQWWDYANKSKFANEINLNYHKV